MAYSLDLRQKVLDACDDGMGTRTAARLFRVSESWVRYLKQIRREHGSIELKAPTGGIEPTLKDEASRIHAHFKACPDTTILELKSALGTDASETTVWRAARALGYRFKKSRSTPQNASGKMSLNGVNSGSKIARRSIRTA